MSTSNIEYLGDLRCIATHSQSGITITSDAPVDNKGKGEAFSPTDLLCTSLAMCMLTIMGIAAQEKDISMEGLRASVTKTMSSHPRRVQTVLIEIQGDFRSWTQKDWVIMKKAADNCPVKLSIHPDLNIQIEWQQI